MAPLPAKRPECVLATPDSHSKRLCHGDESQKGTDNDPEYVWSVDSDQSDWGSGWSDASADSDDCVSIHSDDSDDAAEQAFPLAAVSVYSESDDEALHDEAKSVAEFPLSKAELFDTSHVENKSADIRELPSNAVLFDSSHVTDKSDIRELPSNAVLFDSSHVTDKSDIRELPSQAVLFDSSDVADESDIRELPSNAVLFDSSHVVEKSADIRELPSNAVHFASPSCVEHRELSPTHGHFQESCRPRTYIPPKDRFASQLCGGKSVADAIRERSKVRHFERATRDARSARKYSLDGEPHSSPIGETCKFPSTGEPHTPASASTAYRWAFCQDDAYRETASEYSSSSDDEYRSSVAQSCRYSVQGLYNPVLLPVVSFSDSESLAPATMRILPPPQRSPCVQRTSSRDEAMGRRPSSSTDIEDGSPSKIDQMKKDAVKKGSVRETRDLFVSESLPLSFLQGAWTSSFRNVSILVDIVWVYMFSEKSGQTLSRGKDGWKWNGWFLVGVHRSPEGVRLKWDNKNGHIVIWTRAAPMPKLHCKKYSLDDENTGQNPTGTTKALRLLKRTFEISESVLTNADAELYGLEYSHSTEGVFAACLMLRDESEDVSMILYFSTRSPCRGFGFGNIMLERVKEYCNPSTRWVAVVRRKTRSRPSEALSWWEKLNFNKDSTSEFEELNPFKGCIALEYVPP